MNAPTPFADPMHGSDATVNELDRRWRNEIVSSTRWCDVRVTTYSPSSSPFVPQEGASVVLSIRPECLSLDHNGNSPGKPENCIRGKLEDALYLGELAQYILRTESKPSRIHISELNPTHMKEAEEDSIIATAQEL